MTAKCKCIRKGGPAHHASCDMQVEDFLIQLPQNAIANVLSRLSPLDLISVKMACDIGSAVPDLDSITQQVNSSFSQGANTFEDAMQHRKHLLLILLCALLCFDRPTIHWPTAIKHRKFHVPQDTASYSKFSQEFSRLVGGDQCFRSFRCRDLSHMTVFRLAHAALLDVSRLPPPLTTPTCGGNVIEQMLSILDEHNAFETQRGRPLSTEDGRVGLTAFNMRRLVEAVRPWK